MYLRKKLHEVIFEAETPAGKTFDVILLWAIVLSIVAVLLESVTSIREQFGSVLRIIEWAFTFLFTAEYLVRIFCVHRPLKYMGSFFGIIDLLAILPSYLSLLFTGAHSLLVIRAIRLLRVFRVLKLMRYVSESGILLQALIASRVKITVFLGGILSVVLIMGSLMYLIEGADHGFTSIPRSVYWAIVTMTTVGYGDITPQTPIGQFLSAIIMILGYAIIAVPTGIVSVELAQVERRQHNTVSCPGCTLEGHSPDAQYCRSCGIKL